MDLKENWRFVGNNYAYENGLDTADMETFKKDPIASLARESCQNSIDAKKEGQKKVIIEFKTFELSRENIPGYDRLRAEIENCKEYKKIQNNNKDYEQLNDMSKAITRETIPCLRISDFNTTGLYGDKFYLLTKGSVKDPAKKYKTTTLNIEHNMRTVIKVCWEANRNKLIEIAGYPLNYKPTNSEFIDMVAYYLSSVQEG